MRIRKFLLAAAPYATIIFLCLVTRLPQLLSPHLMLDEDECVVGLMAKHLMEGSHVGVFFYGQSYGFTLVESGMSALYSFIGGLNDHSIKLAMLTLWSIGIIFFYKTCKEILLPNNKTATWLFTLMFIFLPAWAVWSMKARGGYLTAFPLSFILLWYLLSDFKRSFLGYSLTGILLAIIAYSQPLWLPGLLPFLFYCWYHEGHKLNSFKAFTVGNLATIGVFTLLQRHAANYWSPKVFDIHMPGILDLPSLLFDHLNAYYYLTDVYASPVIGKIYSCLFIILIITILVIAVRDVFTDFMGNFLFICAATSIAFTLGYCVFLTDHAPRYLLPLTGFTLIALAILLHKINKQQLIKRITIPFIVIGAVCMFLFKNFVFNGTSEKQLMSCIHWLNKNHIKYVFADDVPTQWQLTFYSMETVISRGDELKDRIPRYIDSVDDAYKIDPGKTAVVDPTTDLLDMEPDNLLIVDKYYILVNPDKELLKGMEFELK
ncbi:MAG TPA: hypothetical protein VK559_00555 [Ferruginibacter sp.]|nr:hypothetical protein [Ferruginibacter sp.]